MLLTLLNFSKLSVKIKHVSQSVCLRVKSFLLSLFSFKISINVSNFILFTEMGGGLSTLLVYTIRVLILPLSMKLSFRKLGLSCVLV